MHALQQLLVQRLHIVYRTHDTNTNTDTYTNTNTNTNTNPNTNAKTSCIEKSRVMWMADCKWQQIEPGMSDACSKFTAHLAQSRRSRDSFICCAETAAMHGGSGLTLLLV